MMHDSVGLVKVAFEKLPFPDTILWETKRSKSIRSPEFEGLSFWLGPKSSCGAVPEYSPTEGHPWPIGNPTFNELLKDNPKLCGPMSLEIGSNLNMFGIYEF